MTWKLETLKYLVELELRCHNRGWNQLMSLYYTIKFHVAPTFFKLIKLISPLVTLHWFCSMPDYPGLVELHILHQLLPHLERGGPRLAVLLRLPGLSLGECLFLSDPWTQTAVAFFYLLSGRSVKPNGRIPADPWALILTLLPSVPAWSLQLSNRKFRTAAMLSVFIVSALVHEYALTLGLGFFYPVMFFLFAIIGGERRANDHDEFPCRPDEADEMCPNPNGYNYSDSSISAVRTACICFCILQQLADSAGLKRCWLVGSYAVLELLQTCSNSNRNS